MCPSPDSCPTPPMMMNGHGSRVHAEDRNPILRRYDRQTMIEGFEQAKLGSAKVLVAGLGTLGSPVALTLALAGVGMTVFGGGLTLVDFDTLQDVNLTRWPLGAQPGDVGRNKAEIAAERLRTINPDINVVAINADVILDLGAAWLAQFDVIVFCVDNFAARVHLNRSVALWVGIKTIPIVEGGLDGMNWVVHTFIPGETPCYECLMQEAEYQEMNRRRSCLGETRWDMLDVAMPMSAVSAAPAAGVMVQEVVQILLGQPPAYAGKELRFIAGRGEPAHTFRLPHRHNCPGHTALELPHVITLPFDATTVLGDLRSMAARRLETDAEELLLVHDQQILYSQTCPTCGYSDAEVAAPQLMARAVLARCPQCQPDDMDGEVQMMNPDVSQHLRHDHLTLAAHGVPTLHIVRAYDLDGTEWVLVPEAAGLPIPGASI